MNEQRVLKLTQSNRTIPIKNKCNSLKITQRKKNQQIPRFLSITDGTLCKKNSNTSTKSYEIKKNVQAILSTSSAHGLNRIFTTKRILFKIMWLNFFICSASFGIYMVKNSISDYYQYEAVTQIRITQEAPTQFPTVTFYNLRNQQENTSLKDVLLSCTFNSKSCNDSDFETKLDKNGNIFFQFNSGRNKPNEKIGIKNVIQSGKSYGLQIELVCILF